MIWGGILLWENPTMFPHPVLLHDPVPGTCCFFFLECCCFFTFICHPPSFTPPSKSSRCHLFHEAFPETPVLFRFHSTPGTTDTSSPSVSSSLLCVPQGPAQCSVSTESEVFIKLLLSWQAWFALGVWKCVLQGQITAERWIWQIPLLSSSLLPGQFWEARLIT